MPFGGFRSPWQRMHFASRMGCTFSTKPHGRPPSGGTASSCAGFFIAAESGAAAAPASRFGSWQPTHETRSPGMSEVVERIVRHARPFPSSTWKRIAFSAGTRKRHEPSASTCAVPRTARAFSWPPRPVFGRYWSGAVRGKIWTTRTWARAPGLTSLRPRRTSAMNTSPFFAARRAGSNCDSSLGGTGRATSGVGHIAFIRPSR